MPAALRLDIDPPLHGWATVRLTAPGVALEFAASHTPRDSINDLARAALGLAASDPKQLVIWNTEPVEFEFWFTSVGSWTRLEVRQFPDSQRRRLGTIVAVVESDTVAFAQALWRGLRRLQGAVATEEFATAWRHSFPAVTVEQLGEQINGQTAS
jgi:hypothetical protein